MTAKKAPLSGESNLKGLDMEPALKLANKDEDKDYWKEVSFNQDHYNEVLDFVENYYIDKEYNKNRAYAESANFALKSIPDKKMELIPETYYKTMKDHKDFDEYHAGSIDKLKKSDKFVVFIPDLKKKKKKKSKKYSDDELRKEKARWKKRNQLLEKEWVKIQFTRDDFLRVIEYVKKLEKKQPKIKLNKVWIAAAQGFLFSLDPHSSLVNKEAWDESQKETEDASFDGIGAILTKRSDDIIIESPLEGQPASKAGLKPGDIIMQVDGVTVTGKELIKVVKMIRGPRGTKVRLTIKRFGEPEHLEIVIIRAHINIPNVQWKMLKYHKDFGYVKITGFVESTPEKLEDAINELKASSNSGDLRGLVLDLRFNSGGLLDAAIAVSDLFLRKGVIVSVKNSVKNIFFNIKNDEMHRAHEDDTLDIPMVVLVNDGSASASEIVASAIQENKRGLVLGDRTFGKASVQTLFNPKKGSGYFIKLTISRYYAPSGRTIQVIGVTPDMYIPEEPDKKMPVGFREEDLSHHLSALAKKEKFPSPFKAEKPAIEKCLAKRGISRKLFKNNPNPNIKFDFQLYKAADILECWIDVVPGKK